MTQQGTSALVAYEGGRVTLERVDAGALTAADLGFAASPRPPEPPRPPADPPGTRAVTFDAASLRPYGAQDDPGAGGRGAIVSEGGGVLTLDGNLWKRVPLDAPVWIGEETRLRVDLAVGATEPELVVAGFDLDEDPMAGPRGLYQLAGTQGGRRFEDVAGTPFGGAVRHVIDLSAHAGTRISSLVLASDDDDPSDGLGSATFSNLAILGAGAPPTGPAQAPFPGPAAPRLDGGPLTVDATDFDSGGQGVSWFDDPGRAGGRAPRGDVDVELVGRLADLGYVQPGEWVEYTVDVARSGVYGIALEVRAPREGAGVAVSLEGGPALARISVPDTNGASSAFRGAPFETTDAAQVRLEAGLRTLRLTFEDDAGNPGNLLDLRGFTLAPARSPEPPSDGVIGEAGVVEVRQRAGEWFAVEFARPLDDPAVVMGPISSNGGQPATMRVRDVTATGFEYQLDEWDYLDGSHTAETVGWMAVEGGVHTVGGLTIAAGVGRASGTGGRVDFGGAFDAAPVVTAQVASTRDPRAVTDRLSGVTAAGFDVELASEEAARAAHGAEDLAWIAIEPGGSPAAGLLATSTGDRVTQADAALGFGGAFADGFALLADMRTLDGADPATVRLRDLAPSRATLFVEEEESRDAETGHTNEDVSVIALALGPIVGDDPIG